MTEDDKMKYSDIIEPDDSIEKLIKQIGELNQSYETMINAIRAGADRVVVALKTASGATSEGRKSIDEATASTSRLERAQNELKMAVSDTGKQIAWLKAQTVDQNKATVEQQRYLRQAVSSYDKLKSDLNQTVILYKSLTEAEKEDSNMGQQLLQDILNLKSQIKLLDDQMKPHIETLTETQKAEQRLAFLQSEEGQNLLDLRAKIAEVTNARGRQKSVTDPLTTAQEKLAYAESEENQQLKLYTIQIKEANQVAQLQATIANSAEGSYNRLSAQYSLNKIKLNQMSQAEREASESGKKLETDTAAIYQQMIKLQESTGKYNLSVGNYKKSWDGLGMSVAQVVRELPTAAINLNTLFIAMSNNIPMVVDEIKRVRAQNKLLQAEGKATTNVVGAISKAFFSWNTILVVVLTVLSMYGDKIWEFISGLFKGKNAVISLSDALDGIAKELESTNANYGSNIVSLKRLRAEWGNLKTAAEKNQWIKENQSDFNTLGVAINSVTDAENVFVTHTKAMEEAFMLRAKAAAGQKLATEQYEKALVAQNKAETAEKQKDPSFGDKFVNIMLKAGTAKSVYIPNKSGSESVDNVSAETIKRHRIQALKDEAKAANATGDAYFNLSEGYDKAANATLKAANVKAAQKKETAGTTTHGRQPHSLTDVISSNDVKIQKQYEESITKLQNDEYIKRRKEASDQVQDANNNLREMYRRNEEYVKNVDGKYKELTESQKQQINQQQKWITATISNNLNLLAYQLQQIQKEQEINSLQIRRETVNSMDTGQTVSAVQENQPLVTTQTSVVQDVSGLEQSLVRERKLVEENLDLEYALIIDTNKKLKDAGDEHTRSEEEILIELNKKKLEIWGKYDQQILDIRKQNIEDQLVSVEKGSDEELKLLLAQNENERQSALAANVAKPATEQVSTSVISAKFDQSATQIQGNFELTGLEEQQTLDEAVFNEVKHNEMEITKFKLEQEKARWQEQIRLAKSGALNWSKDQIDAAESTVKGIDTKISETTDFISNVSEKGLGGSLLEKLGFNDDQIDALSDAANIVTEQLQSIMEAEVELAKQAVEAANERVDAAQTAYEAEVEARSNGYANNVATAKKELELEKKNQEKALKQQEKAQKAQNAIDTLTQASSLVTATAGIWKSFAGEGPWGIAAAIAGTALMWGSFTAAKIKAAQVTASESETYGEGGLEFLEGGSHASGNDIDLGVSNKKKRNMRAEGGEALAVINKKRTKKYRKILPDVVDSLNKGTFEDKYLNAFSDSSGLSVSVNPVNSIDISKIEEDVQNIRKQNEVKYYIMPNGNVIIQRKNVKRIIKN